MESFVFSQGNPTASFWCQSKLLCFNLATKQCNTFCCSLAPLGHKTKTVGNSFHPLQTLSNQLIRTFEVALTRLFDHILITTLPVQTKTFLEIVLRTCLTLSEYLSLHVRELGVCNLSRSWKNLGKNARRSCNISSKILEDQKNF